MKALLVDLDTAWRGGQNQALLILKGLRSRGHEAELLAAEGSALGERAQEVGFRLGLAFVLCLMLLATFNDLVHLNLF